MEWNNSEPILFAKKRKTQSLFPSTNISMENLRACGKPEPRNRLVARSIRSGLGEASNIEPVQILVLSISNETCDARRLKKVFFDPLRTQNNTRINIDELAPAGTLVQRVQSRYSFGNRRKIP